MQRAAASSRSPGRRGRRRCRGTARARARARARRARHAHLDDVTREAHELRSVTFEPRALQRDVSFGRGAFVPTAVAEVGQRLPGARCRHECDDRVLRRLARHDVGRDGELALGGDVLPGAELDLVVGLGIALPTFREPGAGVDFCRGGEALRGRSVDLGGLFDEAVVHDDNGVMAGLVREGA